MAEISEEKWIEMLEKKADGSYIAKYPKVKSKSGTTFDEHLADEVHHIQEGEREKWNTPSFDEDMALAYMFLNLW